ncbi:hypothetical protein GQ61_01305 [Candidatus Nucleicultrix amoebiphila FS5]|uniref:UDP-2,3-diacylglucosamine pyrophosphatase n=2 Tax=Candidatus Nucleicultrix TaxID=1509243 RepID=A0A1W6N2U7_9PROT|nr:hypothetical protein GQ61_01305 [Candidatus Nucleicultrix amoebiphila FS5]
MVLMNSQPPKLAILCGRGALPERLAHFCVNEGRDYLILAFEGQADKEFISKHPHAWSSVGQIQQCLEILKDHQVGELVFAGKFNRPSWAEIKPDRLGAQWMAKLVGKVFGDDSLLRGLIKLIEENSQIKVLSPESIIGHDLLAPRGVLGKVNPDESYFQDIIHGRKVAQTLGIVDVGQSVIVQQGLVIAVEAIEGTDNLIERSIPLLKKGPKGILVKMVKPQQDTRVDRPTIGLKTVEQSLKAGLGGIVMEAEGVILMQANDSIKLADREGLFLLGVTDDEEIS